MAGLSYPALVRGYSESVERFEVGPDPQEWLLVSTRTAVSSETVEMVVRANSSCLKCSMKWILWLGRLALVGEDCSVLWPVGEGIGSLRNSLVGKSCTPSPASEASTTQVIMKQQYIEQKNHIQGTQHSFIELLGALS